MAFIPCDFTLFVSMLVIILALIIFIVILLWGGSGVLMARLSSKLKGKHLMILIQKNGEMKFITGDYKSGSGTVETKDHGDFFLVPSGIYRLAGTAASISYEEFGVNLSGEMLISANALKNNGYKNFAEVRELKDFYDKQRQKYKGDEKNV